MLSKLNTATKKKEKQKEKKSQSPSPQLIKPFLTPKVADVMTEPQPSFK